MSLAAERHCQVCGGLLEGYPCPSCGYAPTTAEAASTEVMGVPLVKFQRMREQSDAERESTLRRWVQSAMAKGHKPASIRYKWRAVYGDELSMRNLMLAVQEVRNGQSR